MINDNLLFNNNASKKSFSKGQVLFYEQTAAFYYHQVAEGKVKMICFLEDGKEVIQGIFGSGESFGEPPLMANFPYPARAIALTDCKIWMLPKQNFLHILTEYPALHFKFTEILCQRIENKANLLKTVCIKKPKNRILSFIDFQKDKTLPQKNQGDYFILPHTRQQLADTLSLRVETVIRALKELESEGEIEFASRKVCRR